MVSGIDEPAAAISRVDEIIRGLGFHSSEPPATAEQAGMIVKSYDTAPIAGVFIVVRYEQPEGSMEIYFAERAQSFSTFALQKRDALMTQIASAFGQDRLTMK